MICPTVRIKVEPSEGNPLGVVVINESDFVEGQHELYSEGEKTVIPVEKTAGTESSTSEVEETPGAPKAPWATKA